MRYAMPQLDAVRVASPCDILWEEMKGTERVRFCGHCQQNVYNLSAMSRREAEELIAAREGRLCIRFYRRADGTVMTQDCPVGLRALRRKVALIVGGAAVALLAIVSWSAAFIGYMVLRSGAWNGPPIPIDPQPPQIIMGGMCPPEPPDGPDFVGPPPPPAPAVPN